MPEVGENACAELHKIPDPDHFQKCFYDGRVQPRRLGNIGKERNASAKDLKDEQQQNNAACNGDDDGEFGLGALDEDRGDRRNKRDPDELKDLRRHVI